MVKNRLEENELQKEIYQNPKTRILKFLFIAFIIFLIGFFYNFPLREITQNKIESLIASNRSCPITYQDLNLSLIPLKLKLNKVTVSPRCYGSRKGIVKLSSLVFKSSGISFVPLGLRFYLKAIQDQTTISAYPTLTLTGVKTKINQSNIESNFINQAIGDNYINGSFSLESIMSSSFEDIEDGKINLSSSNLSIPAKSIQGFQIPNLLLTKLTLKANLKKKNLKVIDFSIGDKESPIVARFNGLIKLNKKNMQKSQIDLIGEMKFSETFLNDFAIINLLLTGKKDAKGFYKIKLTGTLDKLNKPKFL